MKLSALIQKGSLRGAATATVATVATGSPCDPSSVATIATVAVATNPNPVASDPSTYPPLDPDRWCWPHSYAMNTEEIDTFAQRLAAFTSLGMNLNDAEALADRLVIRDRLQVISSRNRKIDT